MVENVSYWLEIAQYDLETAQAMLQAKRYLYVGFMCHQTAEKSIKALIAATGKFPPKLHNLIELATTAGIYNKIDEYQKHFLRELNPLNIEARYPSYISGIKEALNEHRCKEILAETERWYAWIKEQL